MEICKKHDNYGPYTCVFKVCPHVNVPNRTTHFHWMADPPVYTQQATPHRSES